MRVTASVLQLAGLASVVVGAVLEFGLPGVLVSSGITAVYVGLAMERDV